MFCVPMIGLLSIFMHLSRRPQEIANNELCAEAEVFPFDIGDSALLEVLKRKI